MYDKMKKIVSRHSRSCSIPVISGMLSVCASFPAFAEEPGANAGLNSLLSTFSIMTAWLWKECGLLLTWILSQPILLAAMCLFFAGAVVAFFMRIYHQV